MSGCGREEGLNERNTPLRTLNITSVCIEVVLSSISIGLILSDMAMDVDSIYRAMVQFECPPPSTPSTPDVY